MNAPAPATVAYKILTAAQWTQWQADGIFRGAPVDLADGFIHLSTAHQVRATADKHFADETGLILAEVDLQMLGDSVRWEVSRGGELFPHIYGLVALDAVRSAGPIEDFRP